MQYKFKEYQGKSKEYQYPYNVYLTRENKDEISKIYNLGFLPTRIEKDLFYLARNVRIDLKKFEPTSENRRVLKKTQGLELENIKLKNIDYEYSIGNVALEYFKEKFGRKIISTQKLKWLFESGFFTNLIKYTKANEEVGYCITMESDNLLHYAYPFYKKEFLNTNIGIGMMLKAIIHAKEENKQYIYLGTTYTKDSLYKLQFKGLEWFNGQVWDNDIEKLKELIKKENEEG